MSYNSYQFYKRLFDIIAVFIGLIVLSILLLIIALLIKLDSKGPVFFKQERVGKFGERFIIYKSLYYIITHYC